MHVWYDFISLVSDIVAIFATDNQGKYNLHIYNYVCACYISSYYIFSTLFGVETASMEYNSTKNLVKKVILK